MEEGSLATPSVSPSLPQHNPPFPRDEQIVRMLIVMNDALYAIEADPRIEHHRNAQNLFYSCKEWFALHQIGIKKDVRANMYQLDASGYGMPQAAQPAGPHDLAEEQGRKGTGHDA